MNEKFWEEFYSNPHTLAPSSFAVWVNLKDKRVFDFGCGNGRDTHYLAKHNSVLGVDPYAPDGELFHRSTIQNFLADNPVADVAYCRFFFHAVEEDVQGLLVDWAVRNRVEICAEFRSSKDKPNPDHERRLIDGNQLMIDFIRRGFRIEFYQEAYGLAVFGAEDPHIVRIIANWK